MRDQAGQVLLNGTFKTSKNKADETERKADLTSPTGQEKAEGEAEVEIERKNGVATKDELELEVEHLPAMTTCEVFIDGIRAGTFVTTKSGKGKLKLDRDFGERKVTPAARRKYGAAGSELTGPSRAKKRSLDDPPRGHGALFVSCEPALRSLGEGGLSMETPRHGVG